MKTVFKHVRDTLYYEEGTLAFDLPDRTYLTTLFSTHSNVAIVRMGYSLCSDKDRFNKKTGRQLAEKRMSYFTANFKSVELRELRHIYHFQTKVPSIVEGKTIVISFGVSSKEDKEDSVLAYASMYHEAEKNEAMYQTE